MRGCVGEASSSMDTAHSQRTKSTVRTEEKIIKIATTALEVRSSNQDSPMALPSSLVEPVNILQQKHIKKDYIRRFYTK